MLEVKSKRHGGAGYASIIVVSALQSTIHHQVLDVNSVRDVSLNIVYESAEAVMDKEFLNSLKSQRAYLVIVSLVFYHVNTFETAVNV